MISVLYVDDEPELLDITKLFLEKTQDFKIYTAKTVDEGYKILQEIPVDVIVSDYQMPIKNGIDFLKEFRSIPDNRPFILFTGRGREEIVIEAINCGADFYLQKGGDVKAQFAELALKIRQGAARYQAELLLNKNHEELQASYEELAASEEELKANFMELSESRQALAKSEQRLFDIINFLPDATFSIDSAGVILTWNKAIEEMTGCPASSMVGKGNYEYAIPFYGKRIPILIDYILSGLSNIEERYNNIIRDGNKLSAETIYPKHKGIPMIAWGIATPLYNEYGEVIGAIESIRDITMQKENEDKLRKSEEVYRSVIENIQDGYYRSDTEGNLILASPSFARLFGYNSTDEVLHRPIADTFYYSPQEWQIFFKKIKESGTLKNQEIKVRKKDGTPFFVEESSHFYYDDKGNIAGNEGILRDISNRKKIETELMEKEEYLETIIQNAPMGVHRYSLLDDNRLIFTGSNITADRILGINNTILFGKTIEEIFPELMLTDIPDIFRFVARTGEKVTKKKITLNCEKINQCCIDMTIFKIGLGKIAVFWEIVKE
ncbi:PAS domain S-box protein [Methanospirillum sp.]|uniref:PAS domain S-box protein n=1 Tax=Methanospirillum sp. TaxID=45200 RepID=UPI0035A1AE47